jgi:ferredoxin
MKVSNRQAAKDRSGQFEALAAFANMGDSPHEWQKFRLKFPRFFPDESPYVHAEIWLAETLPPVLPYTTTRLLLHRDHLRRVWAGIDHKGESLTILYGFEKKLIPIEPKNTRFGEPHKPNPLFIDGRTLTDRELERGRLPEGEPVVDGLSGEILWKFGNEIQQSIYELMRFRWRAKICAQCGKCFVAEKTAQMYCSSNCSVRAARARSLDNWNRRGSAIRKAKRKGGAK